MSRLFTLSAVALAPLLILGCAETPTLPQSSPLASKAPSDAPKQSTIAVKMKDACDQASFDAAAGPGTCVRNGGMKFDQFVSQLTRRHDVADWDFFPASFSASVGQTIAATNTGGEVHTFTEVKEFGGGLIPFLNQASGTGDMVSECGALEENDFVAPGATYTAAVSLPGTHKYQCCIHPWMRSVVSVK
jgi:plastocyanin